MEFLRKYGTTAAILIAGAMLVVFMLNPGSHPLEGQAAPNIELTDLSGETVRLEDELGEKVILLDFWATWCPPCREGLPVVDAIAKAYKDEPVAVYGVNIMEHEDQVKGFLQSNNLELPVLLDTTGIVAQDYAVEGIPQTVIIDLEGKVHTVHVGLSPWFESTLKSDIDALLARGKSPESDG